MFEDINQLCIEREGGGKPNRERAPVVSFVGEGKIGIGSMLEESNGPPYLEVRTPTVQRFFDPHSLNFTNRTLVISFCSKRLNSV